MSTREYAILLWLFIFFMYGLLRSRTRDSEFELIKSVFKLVAQPAFIVIITYQEIVIAFLISVITKYDLTWWTLKDYIVVFTTTVVGYLGMFQKKSYLKKLVSSVSIAALFSFYLNNFTFSFIIELFLVPVVVFFVLIDVVLNNSEDPKLKKLNKYSKYITNALNIVLITIAVISGVKNANGVFSMNYWESFLIEFMGWVLNLPLLVGSNVLWEFDVMDNYLTVDKTPIRLLVQTFGYFFKKIWMFLKKIVINPANVIIKMEQRGSGNRYFMVTIKADSSSRKVNELIQMIRIELLPKKFYKNDKKVLPFWIQLVDSSGNKLMNWERKKLDENYREENLFLFSDPNF